MNKNKKFPVAGENILFRVMVNEAMPSLPPVRTFRSRHTRRMSPERAIHRHAAPRSSNRQPTQHVATHDHHEPRHLHPATSQAPSTVPPVAYRPALSVYSTHRAGQIQVGTPARAAHFGVSDEAPKDCGPFHGKRRRLTHAARRERLRTSRSIIGRRHRVTCAFHAVHSRNATGRPEPALPGDGLAHFSFDDEPVRRLRAARQPARPVRRSGRAGAYAPLDRGPPTPVLHRRCERGVSQE